MKLYKTEFKLEIVKSILAGEDGVKLLARQRSVQAKYHAKLISMRRNTLRYSDLRGQKWHIFERNEQGQIHAPFDELVLDVKMPVIGEA
ncbi:hypothetical protein [Halothiobacillus sp.]|uniref:hypothetical protein n=1 Tax=Halothiobacillus sp. TaxID=1891311 RepID=UPI002624D2A1|nr:hypothetical protein [Halothiobacillus sp.]